LRGFVISYYNHFHLNYPSISKGKAITCITYNLPLYRATYSPHASIRPQQPTNPRYRSNKAITRHFI